MHNEPAVSLDDLLPEAVSMLQRSMCSNSSMVMSTPVGEDMSAISQKLQLCDDDTLQHISTYLLREIWKVVDSGKNLPVGTPANTEMWKNFHSLRLSDSLWGEWSKFLTEQVDIDISEFMKNIVLQETLKELLEIVVQRRNIVPTDKELRKQEQEYTTHDQEVLRYIAGFIPYALMKKYRKLSSDAAKQYVVFLEKLKVKEDHTDVDSFLEYTNEWTRLQNRGGLFIVNDTCFRLFQAMEVETRKHLSDNFLVEGRSKSIKEVLYKKLISNVYVNNMWDALHGDELANSEGLLRTFVNYWIEIRLRAVLKLYLEKKKQCDRSSRGEKGLRKELSKK